MQKGSKARHTVDDDYLKMVVAFNIYFYRMYRKQSQQNVADFLGVNRVTISDYEVGKVCIPMVKAYVLCKYWGITIDKLFIER